MVSNARVRVRGSVEFVSDWESWWGEGRRRGVFRGGAVVWRMDAGFEQRRRRGQWGF